MIEVLRPHPLRPLKANATKPLTLQRGGEPRHMSFNPAIMRAINRVK